MKKTSFVFILSLFVAVWGCDCSEKISKSSGRLALTPKSLDFQTGCLNDTKQLTFILENQGTSPLTMTDKKLTGSVYSVLSDLPSVIDSRQQVPVIIGFTPTTAQEYAGNLSISTDAAEDATQRVTFIGQGFDGNRYEFKGSCACGNVTTSSGNQKRACGLPTGTFDAQCSFLSFDDVIAGTTMERTLRIQNKGCASVDINEIRIETGTPNSGDEKYFTVTGQKGPLRGGETRDITIVFKADAKKKDPDVKLVITTTDPSVPKAEYGLFANAVTPAMLVDQTALTFYEGQTGVALEKTFTVSNTGDSALKIDSIVLTTEAGSTDFALKLLNNETTFTLAPAGQSGSERVVTIAYTSSGPGNDKGKVTVKDVAGTTAEVLLFGGTQPALTVRWVDPPDVTTEKLPPVDFGVTATGAQNLKKTIRLKNTGQAPLSVTKLELPPADNANGAYSFAAAFAAQSIAAGNFTDVDVLFSDSVLVRNDSAKVAISSDDPIDVANGGKRTIELYSINDPNFKPVVIVSYTTPPINGKTLSVDASSSSGPETTDVLTYTWSMPRKPAGSTAKIENATAAVTKIVSDAGAFPDLSGSYVVKVIVKDQYGNISEQAQSINVQ